MAGDEDQIRTNVLEPDFGGTGARQALGQVMKDIDHYSQILIICLSDTEETIVYHSEMTNAELALLSARVSGYSSLVINGWGDEE